MRKKKNKKERSPILMPKAPVKADIKRRKKSKIHIKDVFKKKNNKYTVRKRKNNLFKYIALLLIVGAVGGVLYLAVNYIIQLRQNAYGEKEYAIENVIGLKDIPTYPNSNFLFKDNMDDPVIKEFISSGNSVYRLPKETTQKNVEEYYTEKLKNLGWELVQNVPIGTPDKKYGMYWVKNGIGLRIYVKYKDIWYETLTESDAREALSRLVKEEIEREMLMASSEKQTLLPDYPWKIEIPKEYLIKYFPTTLDELRGVSFQKLGSSEIVEIYPMGKWKEKDLDAYLYDYCQIKKEQEISCGILNSVPVSFRDTIGLKSTLQINSVNTTAYTVANTYNSIVYVISSSQADSPLLGYIIENIKPFNADD